MPRFQSVMLVLLFSAALSPAGELLFDRTRINRYSLDGLPRSISLRQGERIWFGYDLERAKPFKVWQAPGPRGDSGLKRGYTTRSVGTSLFEDKSQDGWSLARGDQVNPLKIRYLGCTQATGHFEFRWELRHESRRLTLNERVPIEAETVARELKVEGLQASESLRLPPVVGTAWKTADGKSAKALIGGRWTRLMLP
jgi:hypothetical protein